MNQMRPTPRHIVIKMAKVKEIERTLKAKREKQRVTYKGRESPISLSADFSAETLQARRKWHDLCKVVKGKYLQLRILYSKTVI